MKEKTNIFISCGIFKEELEYLMEEKKLDRNIVFLDAVLHVNFDKLKAKLVDALEENSNNQIELKVLYGCCHPEIGEIMERYGARRIGASNCLEAMIGAEEIQRLDSEAKTFFLSAGWVNHWEEMFTQGAKDFNFDFKSMFGSFKRIVVLDTGIIPIDEGKILKFSEFTKLPVERKHITLDHLLRLIRNI
ncbi:MAG: DUF1638 domain-containing protein [Nitrospirota bacterium]